MNETTKYYQVKVQIEREVEDKVKISKEQYIVQAINCTDAETIIAEYFKNTSDGFKVSAITETQIIDILTKDSIK